MLLQLYREIIGALLIFSNRTRPDISVAVETLARSTSDPRMEHTDSAKRTLRYLRGKSDFALKLGSASGSLEDYAV